MNGIHGFSGQYQQGWYGWWGKKEQAERVEAFSRQGIVLDSAARATHRRRNAGATKPGSTHRYERRG